MLDRLSIYRYTSVRTMLDLLGLDYKEYVLALGRYGLDLDDSFLKKDFFTLILSDKIELNLLAKIL